MCRWLAYGRPPICFDSLIVAEPLNEVDDVWREVLSSRMLVAAAGNCVVYPFESAA